MLETVTLRTKLGLKVLESLENFSFFCFGSGDSPQLNCTLDFPPGSSVTRDDVRFPLTKMFSLLFIADDNDMMNGARGVDDNQEQKVSEEILSVRGG